MNKKIFLAGLLCLASVASVVGTVGNAHQVDAENKQTLYFKAPSWWLTDGASVGLHHWKQGGSSTNWPGDRTTKLDGTDNIFYIEIDVDEHPKFIFTRINGSGAVIDWGAKTPDLSWSAANGHNMYDASASGEVWGNPGVSGTWITYNPNVPTPTDQLVNTMYSPYVNNGYYLRKTSINIDMTNDDVKRDLIASFHASAIETERTTYFEGDELWMTNEEGTINSGYGTDGDNLTHFTYKDGVKTQDWKIVQEGGMEGKYTTLKDITISESQNWTELAKGVYKSSDTQLLKHFLDFTAPCFLNSEDKGISNVFTLDYVTMSEENNELIMKLYVKKDSQGFIKDGSLLLSTARISKLKMVHIRGFNDDWISESFTLRNAGQSADLYKNSFELKEGTYTFKFTVNGEWYGNSGTINNGACFDWEFDKAADNCTLIIPKDGIYTFTVNTKTNKLSIAN